MRKPNKKADQANVDNCPQSLGELCLTDFSKLSTKKIKNLKKICISREEFLELGVPKF